MKKREKEVKSEDGVELFKEEFPSDAEISEVVMDKLIELGESRDEAEVKLAKWNREHGI